MPYGISGRFRGGTQLFNMTAVIDIVFLLIIFFMVVCQFIQAENFPVAVPDGCEFAESDFDSHHGVTTVTVMKTDKAGVDFAVGSEKLAASSYSEIVDRLAELIDIRLKDVPPNQKVVTLRIDKNVCFAEAQYALAAIAASSAANIQLATLKNNTSDSM